MKLTSTMSVGKNLWMLKPTMLNRGVGIHIFTELSELETLISDYCKGIEEKKKKIKKKEKNQNQT